MTTKIELVPREGLAEDNERVRIPAELGYARTKVHADE